MILYNIKMNSKRIMTVFLRIGAIIGALWGFSLYFIYATDTTSDGISKAHWGSKIMMASIAILILSYAINKNRQ